MLHRLPQFALIASLLSITQAHAHTSVEPEPSAETAGLQLNLDKATQRRFGLRTRPIAAPAPAVSLPAQVVIDPRRQILLSANQAGTLEAPAGGFAAAGSTVHAGQLLALLRPATPLPEHRDLQSDLAFAHRDVEIGRTQIKRYGINMAEKFDVKLPTPSLQVVLDYRTAEARAKAYGDALDNAIPLIASVDGVLLHTSVRRSAAVVSGQTLFELSTGDAPAIELEFADRNLDSAAATRATTQSGRELPLSFLGESYDPRLRLRRASYALPAHGEAIVAIGEPLQVQVPQRRAEPGHWLVPVAAVVRDHGATWVWVHEAAEQFVAHAVTTTSANPGWIQIEGALDADDRVVIAGAEALQRRARLGLHS